MKIIFLCLGTRGDVQPYVAVGKTASALGHEVTICTGKTFERFVTENGLKFEECSLDLMEILQTREGKLMFEEGMKHPIKAMQYAKRVLNPLYRKAMTEFYKVCQKNDVILFHPKAFGAVDIAEKLGLLCISMPPIPIIYPVSEFPNLAITTKNLGETLNKLTYKLANIGAESNNIKDINEFRKKELQLKKRKSGEYMINRNGAPLPIIYPISSSLFSTVKEFDNRVYLSGFPVLEEDVSLDEETEAFLNSGKKPIIVTFSSMPLTNCSLLLEKLMNSLTVSENRGIIITGNSGIKMASSERILIKEFIPHDVVFRRAKGILHHGGVGTMAAALRSGRPQVIMPFNVDQPFWAKRLFDLGYSLKPLKESDSENEFINRFVAMDHKDVILQAEKIATILNQENPNIRAVSYIEQLCKEWNKENE